MSLEAAAGKNPVTHVGKIYSVLARDIANKLVREVPEIAKAQSLMVSKIGAPVVTPAMLQASGTPSRWRRAATSCVAMLPNGGGSRPK